ncbi:MAG: APC family permease [Bryobacteraceae bacterium]
MATPSTTPAPVSNSLVRALGVADLTWLYLVAVVNLNVVPVIAVAGTRVVWLLVAAIWLFFLPQGIAVIELAEHLPGEGGLYLWTKDSFGDFHGFLCGWCYWMTNMFFVPSLLFYVAGVTSYIVSGSTAAKLNDSRIFFFLIPVTLLWITIFANVRGLGVGKWVNNLGGIGALVIGGALMIMAAVLFVGHRGQLHFADITPDNFGALPLATFGVITLALVGMELGPIMGDEVRDPRRTIPRSVAVGGTLCALMYTGCTLALLTAVPQSKMAVVQGLLQAVDGMSSSFGLGWILLPLAILMAASIAGSTSAWVSGSARILFVCGLDRYLPKALGKVHPRHHSPHVALIMFGFLASAIIAMSFIGASVQEAYLTLLDLAVALQMISYIYLFLVLVKRAFSKSVEPRYFRRSLLQLASIAGLSTATAGFAMAFVPSRQISSIGSFELKMFLTLGFILALASGLFVYYSRLRADASGSGIAAPSARGSDAA